MYQYCKKKIKKKIRKKSEKDNVAQEAHEAIRPTNIEISEIPNNLKNISNKR